jgi:steroid delta-isomerase-like uncharacterized protein
MTTTTTENNKTIARRLLENIDRQDWSALQEMCTPTLQVRIGGQQIDFAAWNGMGKMFSAAFPDGKHAVDNVVAEGDRAVVRCTWTGTQRGAFQGIPASGKTVALATFIEVRVIDGRVAEYRGLFDAMGMMQQIGALPAG